MSGGEITRPQVGLMLSCGEPPVEGRGYPKKLDYIRPKPGAMGQFADAANRFTEVYGDRPRSIDIIFVSDNITEVLDVRPIIFGTSGIKARGNDNLAACDPGEFSEEIRAYDWTLTTYPDNQPNPGSYTITKGRDDKVVTKLGLKVYATLYASIPDVTGLMMTAAITTTSARSMTNWHNAIHQALRLTGGVLVGIPFKLILRPARGRYFDKKSQTRRVTEFQEWGLESRHTITELYAIARERRAALTGADVPQLALPSPELNTATDEEVQRELEVAEAVEVPYIDVETFDPDAGLDVPAEAFDEISQVPAREDEARERDAQIDSFFQIPESARSDQ